MSSKMLEPSVVCDAKLLLANPLYILISDFLLVFNGLN